MTKLSLCNYWKADLHIHTSRSLCSRTNLEDAVIKASECLNMFSITDHDLEPPSSPLVTDAYLSQFDDFMFMPGTEVTTNDGHLLVYNLIESPPWGLSAKSTIEN